jgi:protein gp37
MDIAWVRDLISQCDNAGCPVFVKQLGRNPEGPYDSIDGKGHLLLDAKGGNMDEWPGDLRRREFPCPSILKTKAMV